MSSVTSPILCAASARDSTVRRVSSALPIARSDTTTDWPTLSAMIWIEVVSSSAAALAIDTLSDARPAAPATVVLR